MVPVEPYAVEGEVADARVGEERAVRGTHGDAGGVEGHQDPGEVGEVPPGAVPGEDKEGLGGGGVGDPVLLAGQLHGVVIDPHPGAQRGEVRAAW